MASKHNRSASEQTSHHVIRRRELTAQRNRNYRARQRALQHARTPTTRAQLQQGEQIINLALTEDEQAAMTLTQLGLRIGDVALGQDPVGAQEQEQATAVDEHHTLYEDDELPSEHDPLSGREQHLHFFRRFAARRTVTTAASQPSEHSLPQSQRRTSTHSPSLSAHLAPETQAHPVSTPLRELQRFANDNDLSPAMSGQHDNVDSGADNRDETYEEEKMPQSADVFKDIDDILVADADRPHTPCPSDDESTVSFASEHSTHSEEPNDIEVQPTVVEYMVDKLYEQMLVEFHGCSEQEHTDQRRVHMTAAGDNHYGLNGIFNDSDFPSVLGAKDLLSTERLASQPPPSARQWEAMFCGRDRRRRLPMNVCLHQEETQAVDAKVAFDVDSYLGFGNSLAMARKGVWCQFVPQMRQNMTANVHVETHTYTTDDDSDRPARATLAMLRDVPHFLLGRVEGTHDTTVHVLFPHLAKAQEKFVSLTKDQLTRWLDHAFLPAVHNVYDADYTQHLPGDFEHAYDNSKAHQVEGRQVETASYEAQQAVGYHLQPEYLEQIWNDIVDAVNHTPGLTDFREPQLFFSAKGRKLYFKTSDSRPTLLHVMEHFESFFTDVMDPAFVQLDRFFVDIGKEVCPQVHRLSRQTLHVDEEPQVYLRKRCCLEKYIHWMYDGQPPGLGDGQLYFTQNMLHEAASLTSVTPKRSKQREGGLIYSQLYSSVKEIVDATKRFPFANDAMEEMALDPQIRRGARQAAGGHRRDARIVELGYLASKKRTRDALRASRQKSFGVREEHRISWELFLAFMNRLRLEDLESLGIELTDCPSYAWPVKTSVYMDYLWRSADKFATGFEVVRARCRQDLVTWEQTKMMAMFLRCLRFVFGGHLLRRESALWWSRRERYVGEPPRLRLWYGLGFNNTLPRYGYCWLEPRVDWEQLRFQSDVTDHMLFGNGVLRGQYLQRGQQVQAFFDTTRRLETALEWLERYRGVIVIRVRMILWIVHICLQQFRVDIMQTVKAEIHNQKREEALLGTKPFCLEHLEEIMADGVYRMSGNRSDFKVVSHLGHFLFDFEDGRIRKHWDDRPYRVLYRRALTAVSFLGRDMKQVFRQCFWRMLYQYHWILPYPCANALMQTTKQGQRMWYSIKVNEDRNPRTAEEKDWIWAQKDWQPGTPKTLPEWMDWEKEGWERWIDERGGSST